VLASIVKNDISHDYVVGNPPWVAKQNRYTGDEQERRLEQLYYSAWGESDPYMEFMERGLDMLHTGGKLGFVVSNRFLYNSGAKEIRALLSKNQIREIIDFTDVPIFDEATNYTSIVTVEKEVENDDWGSFIEDNSFSGEYEIQGTRVRQWDEANDSGDPDIPNLVETIRTREEHPTIEFFEVDSSRVRERVWVQRGEVHREETSSRYTANGQRVTVSRKLPIADVWPFCPEDESQLLDQIEDGMDLRLGDRAVIRGNQLEDSPNLVGDGIRVGIQTSGDSAYIVHPTVGLSKEKFADIDTLPITPRAVDETYTVETDLLKIDISSEDVDRWLPSWDNRLVFVPYKQGDGDERAELIRPQELHDNYNLTWQYFTDASVLETLSEDSVERKEIHNRLAFELGVIEEDAITDEDENQNFRLPELSSSQYQSLSEQLRSNVDFLNTQNKELWWYRYMYRKNIENLPRPKILTGDLVQRNKLCFDEQGIMAPHNVSVYSFVVDDDKKYAIAGVLNSALLEYYHKHHSRIHKGKAYRYIEDYISKWPIQLPDGGARESIESTIRDILHLKDLEAKIPQFPDPYILEARESGEEFVDISFTPNSSFTAAPSIQNDLAGDVTLVMDDGQSLSESIDSEVKARYVQKALEDMRLHQNQTVTIPVPLRDEVAQDALDELEEDISARNEGDIDELEQEIDQVVFDLYDLEDENVQEHINRYNSQHDSVRPLDPLE